MPKGKKRFDREAMRLEKNEKQRARAKANPGYRQSWREDNRARVQAAERDRYDPVKAHDKHVKRMAKDPEKERERHRVRRAADPEGTKAKGRAQRAKDPDAANARTINWRTNNPDKVQAYSVAYYWADPEKARKRTLESAKKNPIRVLASNQNYRAAKKHAEGSFTPAEWIARKASFEQCCIDCGMREGDKFKNGKTMKLTVGHAVPLKKLGSNWISNLIPQCGPCNSKQHAKLHATARLVLLAVLLVALKPGLT